MDEGQTLPGTGRSSHGVRWKTGAPPHSYHRQVAYVVYIGAKGGRKAQPPPAPKRDRFPRPCRGIGSRLVRSVWWCVVVVVSQAGLGKKGHVEIH